MTTFYGEMRIYLKYIKRLNNLDFLTDLNVNFDTICLNREILRKITNLKSIQINFTSSSQLKWTQLLEQSRILQNITINWPVDQNYLDLMPYYARNCKILNLNFSKEINLLFISKLVFLTTVQMIHQLNPLNVFSILQFKLKYLTRITFNYAGSELTVDFFSSSNHVRLIHNNKFIIFNLDDFENQIRTSSDWARIVNNM